MVSVVDVPELLMLSSSRLESESSLSLWLSLDDPPLTRSLRGPPLNGGREPAGLGALLTWKYNNKPVNLQKFWSK